MKVREGRALGAALALACLVLAAAGGVRARAEDAVARPDAEPSGRRVQRIVQEGIAVELTVEPLGRGKKRPREPREGGDVSVVFRVTDTATGTPLAGLRPAVWIDPRRREGPGAAGCKDKVRGFVGGSLGARAGIDLNVFYVLALNEDSTISVIDPLFGYAGDRLLTVIWLRSPGEDWALAADQKRLFVTMPAVDQVAVADTTVWKVVTNVDVGRRPTRAALQPDGRYLWVSVEDGGPRAPGAGVTVIDTGTLQVAARIRTGGGPHDIAFADDGRYAFVTNQAGGTLSVADTATLRKVTDVRTGPRPASVAFSSIARAAYVTHEGDGSIVAVGGRRHEILTRIATEPGLGAVRFAPGGRLGFALNPKKNRIHIFDAATNRIVQEANVADFLGTDEPFEVVFTAYLAYVRSRRSEHVLMIPLESVGRGGPVKAVDFPGGQAPVGAGSRLGLASTIVPAPEGTAVLVANPADRTIYYYREGMAAPMGSYRNYGRQPRAVLAVDRGLREAAPGVYASAVKLTGSGEHDVAFLLDSPRVLHCFDLTVQPDPGLDRTAGLPALLVRPVLTAPAMRAGEEFRLRVKVLDRKTSAPKDGLSDFGVLAILVPGIWQERTWARPVGDGVYEVSFVPPETGVYYVFFQCPSLGVKLNQLPFLTLQATDPAAAGTGAPVAEDRR